MQKGSRLVGFVVLCFHCVSELAVSVLWLKWVGFLITAAFGSHWPRPIILPWSQQGISVRIISFPVVQETLNAAVSLTVSMSCLYDTLKVLALDWLPFLHYCCSESLDWANMGQRKSRKKHQIRPNAQKIIDVSCCYSKQRSHPSSIESVSLWLCVCCCTDV